jgi:hypothetical protein
MGGGINAGYYYRNDASGLQNSSELANNNNGGLTKVSPYLKYSRDI